MEREIDYVRTLGNEILRGPILSITEPITNYGIAVVPIIATRCQSSIDDYLNTNLLRMPTKAILRTATCFGISITRRSNGITGENVKEKIENCLMEQLPQNCCGVVILDSKAEVMALNLNLNIRAFCEQIGLVMNLVMKYYILQGGAVEKKLALANTILFLARLGEIRPTGIIETNRWGDMLIGLPSLVKEFDIAPAYQGLSKALLYCSIGV